MEYIELDLTKAKIDVNPGRYFLKKNSNIVYFYKYKRYDHLIHKDNCYVFMLKGGGKKSISITTLYEVGCLSYAKQCSNPEEVYCSRIGMIKSKKEWFVEYKKILQNEYAPLNWFERMTKVLQLEKVS